MLLMNCSNPYNVLDKLAHSKVKSVNVVREEINANGAFKREQLRD